LAQKGMHEAGLAQSIVKMIVDTALRNQAKDVVRVEMEVGELCLVNIEQLAFLIRAAARNSIAKDMELSAKAVAARIHCKDCEYVGPIEYKETDPEWHYRVPNFGCSSCRSNNTEIIQGKDLMIRSIDVR